MGSQGIRPESSIGAALFGATRQAVLRILFGHSDQRLYLRQIIRTLQLGTGAVQRELVQLSNAGIVTRVIEGNQTYYQANPRCPIYEELRSLIRKTFGVADILRRAMQPMLGKIQVAFIYGSVASGREAAASDIDVMVVGAHVSLDEVVSAFSGIQRDLGREVNPTVYPTGEFCRKLAAGQHFLASVIAGPKIFLLGDDGELARLAQVRVAQGAQDKPAGNRRPVRRRRS